MNNNTFINLKSVQFFSDREVGVSISIVGIFCCFACIYMILSFKASGIVLGIIFLIPLFFLTKFSYNIVVKPALTLTESCIYNFNKKIKLNYYDIYEVSISEKYKGKKLFFKMKNIEKYSKKDIISFQLRDIDIDDNEIIDILNKKIKNSDLNIMELFNDYEEKSKTNVEPLIIRTFNIILSLFFLMYIGYSIHINELILVSRNHFISLTGIPMYIISLSVVFFIVRLLIIIIQYYEKNYNKKDYEKYKIPLTSISLILFFTGLFYNSYI